MKFALLLSLLVCPLAVPAQERSATPLPDSAAAQPLTINFCRMIRDPTRYAGKLVRIRASWVTWIPDSTALINTSCLGRDTSVVPELICGSKESCDRLVESLKGNVNLGDIVSDGSRIDIILVGRLKTGLEVWDCPKDKSCFSFYVQRVERAIKVKSPIPWEKL